MNLRERRRRLHLSLRGAAEEIEVDHRTLGRYESGESEPRSSVIQRMAEVYGCLVDDVVASVEASSPSRDPTVVTEDKENECDP